MAGEECVAVVVGLCIVAIEDEGGKARLTTEHQLVN